ncbi:hypothetical protein PROFUN_07187 [Planoprotostelium fungivorum]|uniref:Uncharacterized protein n=1 Tax=Planoprotostelium fungivorum TaxID=1890364 RepID=A0A2P6NMB8_9EUKA|nr:hypothetical protein PROFUN_07187 [Planoprotostelium fungivorum]
MQVIVYGASMLYQPSGVRIGLKARLRWQINRFCIASVVWSWSLHLRIIRRRDLGDSGPEL